MSGYQFSSLVIAVAWHALLENSWVNVLDQPIYSASTGGVSYFHYLINIQSVALQTSICQEYSLQFIEVYELMIYVILGSDNGFMHMWYQKLLSKVKLNYRWFDPSEWYWKEFI